MCEFEIRIGNEQIYTTYLDIWWLCCHYSLFIIVNSTRCAFFSVSLSRVLLFIIGEEFID